ncbi:alpha/beta hydrolase [Bacillus sp. 1P10SD]|uniref:alpha/beta fold hydrolase n=1 Tax=Bacillus sp. 1P10SD TaxID=3132265 RepID=UPI0039A65357
MFTRKTKKIISEFESIAALEEVMIGGVKQTILLRGDKISNPIMLFLHGGPGSAQIGFAPKFQRELEKKFVVVNWDQRGSGLSFSRETKKEELTVENIFNDTIELIEYLLRRFNQPKLFLVGHSWGSVLGTLAAQKKPDYIHSYIGIGQVVDFQDGEKLSYEFTLKKANEQRKTKAIKDLEGIEFNPADMKFLDVKGKWLSAFGGSIVGVGLYNLVYSNMLFGTEYTLKDWITYMKAGKLSLETIWPQLMNIDFRTSVPSLDVPVYIFAGKHDYQVPSSLAKQYFETLEAPYKEFIWFENSAHLLNFEEPDKFFKECLKIKEKYS